MWLPTRPAIQKGLSRLKRRGSQHPARAAASRELAGTIAIILFAFASASALADVTPDDGKGGASQPSLRKCRTLMKESYKLPALPNEKAEEIVDVCAVVADYFYLGAFFEHFEYLDEAKVWYQRAVDDGDVTAAVLLGRILVQTEQDEKAAPLYRWAVDAGDRRPLLWLGHYYVVQNEIEGIEWFRRVTEGDHALRREVARHVIEGAWAHYLQTKEARGPRISRSLDLYVEGLSSLVNRCPDSVLVDAGYLNAWLSVDEAAFRENSVQVVGLLRRLADELGCYTAQEALGYLYAEGEGFLVDKDREEGLRRYRRALRMGSVQAKRKLEALGQAADPAVQ